MKWRESSAPACATVEPGRGISKQELETAYREHSAFVWRNARRFGCDSDTAEDVVHEVFLVVASRFESFRREASLRTWLFAITYRMVQRITRDHSRRGARLQRYFELHHNRPEPREYDRAEASNYLTYLLSHLEKTKRVVFIMMELEEMTADEVGRCLGVKSATVESRLRSARLELARAIERDGLRERRWSP
ncbi:MAG TPA: RNA polymerase sigma factor [Polyangiaceae bacterium]